MASLEYLIVGLGISGISFCEELEANGKNFMVVDSQISGATSASGGVFNPMVLKRFTPVWNAEEHITRARTFYTNISAKLDVNFVEDVPVFRILNSIEEQNNWLVASDRLDLKTFISASVVQNKNQYVNAPYGFGKVLRSGKIFPTRLLDAYRNYLKQHNRLRVEVFKHDALHQIDGSWVYQGIEAKKIIFAEGPSAKNNPYFPSELLLRNKGEYIIVKAPLLQLSEIIKGPMFIIPLGNDLYKVGASFDRDDKTPEITEQAKNHLSRVLSKMIDCPFEVVDQVAGMRPTTRDRRPLLGALPENPDLIFFNGLGTRGIMIAPTMSRILYEHIELGTVLPHEIDIQRFF